MILLLNSFCFRHVEGTPLGLGVSEGVRAQTGLAGKDREIETEAETEGIVSLWMCSKAAIQYCKHAVCP